MREEAIPTLNNIFVHGTGPADMRRIADNGALEGLGEVGVVRGVACEGALVFEVEDLVEGGALLPLF